MNARITALVTVLLALIAPSLPAFAETPILSIENEFVRAVVNQGPEDAGRFSIRTTGGDPSRPASANQPLVFGGNAPWTSYTTVMVDNNKYGFGGPTKRRAGKSASYGKLVGAPSVEDNKLVTACQFSDVEVRQTLGFVRGLSTRMLDTIGITYTITNKGDAPHQVGLRVVLDTMCGSNDGAPIRAGNSAITTASTIAGRELPDFWQAFDSLAKPTVISQGTLRGGQTTPPDKVLFADWGTLADEPWEPIITAGQGFIRKGEADADTATALFWNPVAVDPGQTITYTTYYGIGDVNIKGGNFTIGLTGPAETTFAYERTESFTIAGYVQNTGGFEGRDVVVALKLPDGLTLVGGSKIKETFPSLKPDEIVQKSWIVRPNGKGGGTSKLVLEVSSANIEANEIARDILVNVPKPKLLFVPDIQRVPAATNGLPTLVPIQINLAPAESFAGMRFTVRYNADVVRPLGAPFGVLRGRAFVENGRLLKWTIDDSEDGRLVISGVRNDAAPLTQAEINLATIKFRVVGTGKTDLRFEKAAVIDEKGTEHPVEIATGSIEVTE